MKTDSQILMDANRQATRARMLASYVQAAHVTNAAIEAETWNLERKFRLIDHLTEQCQSIAHYSDEGVTEWDAWEMITGKDARPAVKLARQIGAAILRRMGFEITSEEIAA